jgi:hypothetical protein
MLTLRDVVTAVDTGHARVPVTQAMVDALNDPEPWAERPSDWPELQAVYLRLVARYAKLPLNAVARLCVGLNQWDGVQVFMQAFCSSLTSHDDLYEAARMAGVSEEEAFARLVIADAYYAIYQLRRRAEPHVARAQRFPDALLRMIRGSYTSHVTDDRVIRMALTLFDTLEHVEDGHLDAMRELGLSTRREVREVAQRLAERHPGLADWLLRHLTGGSAAAREHAATWAASVVGEGAVDGLRAAAAGEKVERALVAQLRALDRLGIPADEAVDRDALTAKLRAAGAKLPPPEAFETAELPTLRWRDGVEVDAAIFAGMIATAHKRKKADPTPMQQVLAAGFEPEGRAAMARALLTWWIAVDDDNDLEPWEWFRGAGTSRKGVLSWVAALGDDTLVEPAMGYVHEHYGVRAAQSKALLTMLAYIGTPRATQELLAVAKRFRTRGIQKVAQAEVEAMAERRGWSADELADRTLAGGGLGPSGTLALVYVGEPGRTFVLTQGSGLDLRLTDAAGKTLRSLPSGRADEDDDSIKAAKSAMRKAKKAHKALLTAQVRRLAEAMLTQRTWSQTLWRETLLAHPVMARICRQLVWHDGEGHTFRPTEDGSLVDADSEPFETDADVRVAHAMHVDADGAAAWAEHFADYELIAPIQQLERPVWRPEDADATSLVADATVSALKLRTRARKLGYDLEPAGSGGYVEAFYKDLLSLKLTVRIHVSDLALPVENANVPLTHLTVEQDGQALALGDLHAVLVSELHADLQDLASVGVVK